MLFLFHVLFYVLPSVVFVHAGFVQQTFIPYKGTFGLNFLQGRVIRIDTTEKFVVLDNGKVLICFLKRSKGVVLQ